MVKIVNVPEFILTELYKSKSGKGYLIRNNKADMPYAIQIYDVENHILLSPESNLVQTAIAKFLKNGFVDLHDDTICLTTVGRNVAKKLYESL